MSFGWLKSINWVDILFAVVMLRIIYIGFKKRLVVEFFKFLGILFSIFLGLHYYTKLAEFISSHSALPQDLAKVIVYIGLIFLVVLVFKFIVQGILLLFKIEPKAFLDKWLAVIISFLRAGCICSLIGVFFSLSTVNYLKFSLKQSLSGNILTKITPVTYNLLYKGVVSKFFPNEPLNQEIFDVLEGSSEKETEGEI